MSQGQDTGGFRVLGSGLRMFVDPRVRTQNVRGCQGQDLGISSGGAIHPQEPPLHCVGTV